jgi:hypothetical protein
VLETEFFKLKNPIVTNDNRQFKNKFTTFINRFERSCGTFGEEKKNPLSSMTLGWLA